MTMPVPQNLRTYSLRCFVYIAEIPPTPLVKGGIMSLNFPLLIDNHDTSGITEYV